MSKPAKRLTRARTSGQSRSRRSSSHFRISDAPAGTLLPPRPSSQLSAAAGVDAFMGGVLREPSAGATRKAAETRGPCSRNAFSTSSSTSGVALPMSHLPFCAIATRSEASSRRYGPTARCTLGDLASSKNAPTPAPQLPAFRLILPDVQQAPLASIEALVVRAPSWASAAVTYVARFLFRGRGRSDDGKGGQCDTERQNRVEQR